MCIKKAKRVLSAALVTMKPLRDTDILTTLYIIHDLVEHPKVSIYIDIVLLQEAIKTWNIFGVASVCFT